MALCETKWHASPRIDCPEYGYPTLGGMCIEHYTQFIIKPRWDTFCKAEDEWHRVQNNLYRVECANGLRPTAMAELVDPADERKARYAIDYNEILEKRKAKRANQKSYHQEKRRQLKAQIIDDGEINNDI